MNQRQKQYRVLKKHRDLFPTLRDIAMEAQVSMGTVQNVFHGLSRNQEVVICLRKSIKGDVPQDLTHLFDELLIGV